FTKGDLIFATRNVNTNTAATERITIKGAGNIGIGASPTALADLDLTSSAPNAGTLHLASATASRCARFDTNSFLVAASGDCTAGAAQTTFDNSATGIGTSTGNFTNTFPTSTGNNFSLTG